MMARTLKLHKAPPPVAKREVERRWTPKLTKDGWTPISDYFLENYHRLTPPLTTSEAMLVIHLMRHKWDESPPFPAFKTLAKRMGVSATAARNHARSLDAGKKYLRRMKRVGQPNRFDLTPLFDALEKLRARDLKLSKAQDSQPRSA